MKCTNCNKENKDDFIFCRCCGTKNKQSGFDLLDKSLHKINWQFYLKKGEELTNDSKHYEALEYFNEAVVLNPNEPDIYNARGKCYMRILYCPKLEYKNIEALADFNTALKLNPDNLQTLINIGNTKQGLRKHNEAIEIYNQILIKEPLNIDVLTNRAFSKMCIGDYKGVKKDTLEVFKIIPDHPYSLYIYGKTLLIQCDFKKGIATLKKSADKGFQLAIGALNNLKPIQYMLVAEIKNKGFILGAVDNKAQMVAKHKYVFEILNNQPIDECYKIVKNSKYLVAYTIIGTQNNLKECSIFALKIEAKTFSLRSFIKKRENRPISIVKRKNSLVVDKCDIEDECQLEGDLLRNFPSYSIAKELPTPKPPSYVNIMASYRTEGVL